MTNWLPATTNSSKLCNQWDYLWAKSCALRIRIPQSQEININVIDESDGIQMFHFPPNKNTTAEGCLRWSRTNYAVHARRPFLKSPST